MKKILMAATAALCFAGGSFAQENAGGANSSSSSSGNVNGPQIVFGAVGLGVLGGMVSNNRGNSKVDDIIPPVEPPVECGAGEELIDGDCVPITTTTTLTTTVTNTVTNTITTPVTVTATTTL
jgi:hypothetical protein